MTINCPICNHPMESIETIIIRKAVSWFEYTGENENTIRIEPTKILDPLAKELHSSFGTKAEYYYCSSDNIVVDSNTGSVFHVDGKEIKKTTIEKVKSNSLRCPYCNSSNVRLTSNPYFPETSSACLTAIGTMIFFLFIIACFFGGVMMESDFFFDLVALSSVLLFLSVYLLMKRKKKKIQKKKDTCLIESPDDKIFCESCKQCFYV